MTTCESVCPDPEGIKGETATTSSKIGEIARLLRSTVRQGWSSLANQGVVSATNFLTGVIIGRFCSKSEFGLYILGFSIVLFLLDLQASLVTTPYMVYCPRLKGRRLHLYNGSVLIHQLGLSAMVLLALILGGGVLSWGLGPPGLARVVWALAAATGFIMFREFVRRICFAQLRMEAALLFDLCVAAGQLLGLLILYHFGILSAHLAYLVIGCACGAVGTGWLFLHRQSFFLRVTRSIADFRDNWQFGKWVLLSGMVWVASMSLYPWFLSLFHGTDAVGIWGACLGVAALVGVPLAGVQNVLGPKIANVYAAGGAGALRRFAATASLFLVVGMSLLSSALFFAGGPLLVLFYGAKYGGNGLVASLLALGLVAASLAFAFSRALFAIERADVDFKINFIPLLVLFTLGIWLVRAWGPLGAAWGLLLAHLAASAVRCAAFALLTRSAAQGAS